VPLGAEGHAGRVSLQGLEWAARSLDGEPIGAGALVRVVRVEGVTLIVDSEPETGG
jgi:membrane protein implicated in regulation of membrane protease activity